MIDPGFCGNLYESLFMASVVFFTKMAVYSLVFPPKKRVTYFLIRRYKSVDNWDLKPKPLWILEYHGRRASMAWVTLFRGGVVAALSKFI
jgi:hypothetical protein